ncbi:prolipoprotein diacylglyceryl transferase [Candidatus Woesearchaeota archaeon]|nr:prolipoprotein diacylglyceryl transferase [Candidatus Woesearchaeota archaeon]
MPFVHNLDPVLFYLWNFQIRYYGLAWAFGFLVTYYFIIKSKDKLNVSREELENYMVYLILSIVIGARLFHVLFSDPGYYFANPFKIFALWEGGVAFHGGLTGAILSTFYFVRKNNVSWKKLGDILVVPAALFLAIGRIANFINGELYGTVTDVSWCVNFKDILGCRHPSQLYESLANFLIFGVLLFFRKTEKKEGVLLFVFVLLMGVTRFLISFLREDPKWLGLSDGQYFSLIMILAGGYFLYKNKRITA